jgi:magnesium chelatase family protein
MARAWGAALRGVDGVAVEVEVQLSSQLPRIDIVGLPEAAVRESAARVRAAISSIGQKFPEGRITVNLAPANMRKGGAGLDLPIAVGILAATGAVEHERVEPLAFVGELALDGRLRPVRGALALALAARDAGCKGIIVPRGNAMEAALMQGLDVRIAADLGEVVRHLLGGEPLSPPDPAPAREITRSLADLSDVRGQEGAKRALEVAAAGGHALLLRGSPGAGKSMLARRLPGLLPALSFDEAVEVSRVHGAAGQLNPDAPIISERPFRAPHHTTSSAGLLGGGNPPGPGEVSLAHRGVLFLDELPEFQRPVLESLREVLEQHRVTIARARVSSVFPASFQLVAAQNPCPCGWFGSGIRDCRCDDATLARYERRVSGPLLDRIDLRVDVRPVGWGDLDAPAPPPSSHVVRERVVRCRQAQHRRGDGRGFLTNAEIGDDRLDRAIDATPDARALLGRSVERLALSARGARSVLRVSRTIADIDGEARVGPHAIAEALSYRKSPHGAGD